MAPEASASEVLRSYLNSLERSEQEDFAARCKTTVGYLRKVISTGERMRESLVVDMDRESGGVIRCEVFRPDVDWAYLRGSAVTASPSTVASVNSA